MPRSSRLIPLAMGAILLAASSVRPALADFEATITTTVSHQSGGLYFYSYLISDSPSSTDSIGEFDLSLTTYPFVGVTTPAGAPISSITMAPGFINDYTTGDPSISFQSTDPSTDIQPGMSGTFSFTSTFAPVLVPYQFDTYDGTGNIVSGLTLAPATVPEPSSLVLVGVGLAGIYARWRSRKAPAA